MPFNPGENIGPYRIMEQLGQGGMATVYKAYHAALDRYVALKVLHPAFGEEPSFEARFKREARLVAKLEHPNIIPIFDYAEHEKRPFLVMKYVEGETLKARMARGPLGTAELARIIEAIGSALAYAHKMGILHRDIKPSNVLLTSDGSIYLADFGLARIASMGESTLSGDMIMGTPQYISPEQAMGKKDLDEGTDIYSFGVMLYEMVVGQVPFNADTPFSIIHDHIYTPLPIPHNINPNVPESVERVLLKALSKERADRYASVTDMVGAFKQAWLSAGVPMKGTTITMPPQPPPETVKPIPATLEKKDIPVAVETAAAPEKKEKKKKKLPRWVIIAGSILLVLCCLLGFVALRDARREAGVIQESILTEMAQFTPDFELSTPFIDIPIPMETSRLVTDFEGEPPENTSGWQGFIDDATESVISCVIDPGVGRESKSSLHFKFSVVPNSWATCGFYYNPVQNWGEIKGISFYLRSDRAGIPFEVNLYGGTPDVHATYYFRTETPPESVENWAKLEIPLTSILGAEWENNAGKPFDPTQVTGFSISVTTQDKETSGKLWIDDLKMLGGPTSQISIPNADTLNIESAQMAVTKNPKDAYAHLRLALAYWDGNQPRRAYETLNQGAELAGQDRGFFMEAAREFAGREAWLAAAGMYQRAILLQPGGEIPEELLNSYHEAVYRAAASTDLSTYLPFETIARVDESMAFIAEGRSNLHRGDNVKARDFLERARRLNPGMPEITLLDAEISIKEGRKAEARELLNQLMANPDTPEWIRTMADTYLKQNP